MPNPFHPQVPQSNDDPKVSQGDLLDNNQSLNAQWLVNHTNLTASSNQGYHTQAWFPTGFPYTTDPNLAAPAASLYPKIIAGGTTELFFQNGALNSNVEQLTNLPIVNGLIATITNAANGVVTVANGLGHGLQNGDTVVINGAYGMAINGMTATVASVTTTTFETGINTTALGTYVPNSGYYNITSAPTSGAQNVYGMMTPWGLILNFGQAGINATVIFAVPYTPGFVRLFSGVTPTTGIASNFTGVTSWVARSMTYKSVSAANYFIAIGK